MTVRSGWTDSTPATIGGTPDSALYQSERYGNFAYSFPVPSGKYRITLKEAEYYWRQPNQRVFNVTVNGVTWLDHYDILARAGFGQAIDSSIIVSVTDGNITLDFAADVDAAKISAIAIEPST